MKKGDVYQIGFTSGKSLKDCTQIKAIEILQNDFLIDERLDIGFKQEKGFLTGFTALYIQAGIRYWGFI